MKVTTLVLLILGGFLTSDVAATKSGLRYNHYQNSCRQAEDVIAKMMKDIFSQDPRVAPRIIRLHFHDCFVRGCDGSVLLNSTSGNKAEKDARPNTSLMAFDIIDQIKEILEKQCRNVVSCSDILAYAARESVFLTGKSQRYYIRGGRKDGRVSRDFEAFQNLPPPFADVNFLIRNFASKNLSLEDMVTLSGGHSIGASFCSSISGRYSNFNNTGKPDPTLNPDLAAALRRQCGSLSTANNRVFMDTITPTILDNKYYTGLLQNKGLFTSDAALLNDKRTLREVVANGAYPSAWERKFADAMRRMGEIEVLTGEQGEIRRKCGLVN